MATEADKQLTEGPRTEAPQADQPAAAARAADRLAAEQRLAEIVRKTGVEPRRRSRYGPFEPAFKVTERISWRELARPDEYTKDELERSR